jgi:hypothetical protein
MARPLRYDDYTVGWVCALPVELAAAQVMLDKEHPDLERDPADENLYSLGSLCRHNVVIACLPAGHTGNTSAAAVATEMRKTFKSIRFGLMWVLAEASLATNMTSGLEMWWLASRMERLLG